MLDHNYAELQKLPKVEGLPQNQHFFGEVYPQYRKEIEWPPRCILLVHAMARKAIWHTYKAGRFFPMRYVYSVDPRCLECEGEATLIDECLFDVSQLPRKYLRWLKIDGDDIDFNRESRHIRNAIGRAITDGHDFIAHQKSVGWR